MIRPLLNLLCGCWRLFRDEVFGQPFEYESRTSVPFAAPSDEGGNDG